MMRDASVICRPSTSNSPVVASKPREFFLLIGESIRLRYSYGCVLHHVNNSGEEKCRGKVQTL